ncbi:hypothetical protein [Aporhodopirellula aestuarii]|uniref:Type 4 fimbrial biogenesis protein PilX N-terminal domain-containing protein n=1 Tax=Aporhodopirellula aestuarii TaxID=2950107 RepID=A0ABT0UD09_9BACT|nr:hypothetical protein [Aporhodopirellula aestuarii]MCM2374805.1 hypothetical protein [Aporhodopirellula aestuarii]
MNLRCHPVQRPRRHPRRGTALYISVVSTAMIVSLLGLAGMCIMRIERRHATSVNDRLIARSHAKSAVELGLRYINADSSWHTTYSNSVETTPLAVGPDGTGTVSFMIEDTDGSLTDSDTELRLKGIGRLNNTVQVTSVEITGSPEVIDTLQCSVYAAGNTTQSSNSTTNSGPFACGSTITVNGAVIGDVEGSPVVVVGSVSGTVTDPGPARTLPSPDVWDTYLALATPIPYTNFPVIDTSPNQRVIARELLSGNVNPFGSLNPEGIYYVQIPSGGSLTANKSRLNCTLLIELLGTASFDTIQSCLWDPFNGNNYPCAIVKGTGAGDFQLKSSNATLKESQTPKQNFNPPGNPYDGVSNTENNDSYTPLMRGLFHVIGSNVHTILASNLELHGVVVTEGTCTLGANLTVTLNPNIYSDPPLGYDELRGDVAVVPGTWNWDAAPTP